MTVPQPISEDPALERKDALLRAVARAARTLLAASDDEVPLRDVLAHLGEATGVSRIYAFRNHRGDDGALMASQVAEWTQPQVPPQLDNPELQDVPYEAAGMGRWAAELSRDRTIAGTLEEFPAAEQALLRPQGILSLVVTPVRVGGEPWGFIGFDDCEVPRRWSSAELDILRAAADIVASALERRATLEALEESREQLRHAQRLEAIGRLAGGIAHDFNNILSGILGNAELLLAELEPDHRAAADVDEIRKAALRAAGLTRQLLAFSRNQATRPEPVDLDWLLSDMQGLLGRLIGDDVALDTALEPGLPALWADASQVEQVILNLVVNARDAMPGGGRITIRAQAREPGPDEVRSHGLAHGQRYVLLSVADTGTGMDQATVDKAFEPFFTTKASGTGMGLSIIYGIAKQGGGSAWIESATGEGACVTVAFPVSESGKPSAPGRDDRANAAAESLAGSETLLLVEDDAAVRKLASRMLGQAGYRVLEASSADAGVAQLRAHGHRLDLLVTDIRLPGRSGIELKKDAAALLPGLPVLFVSGFPGQRDGSIELPDDTPDFLVKPFTREQLLGAVRKCLDAR